MGAAYSFASEQRVIVLSNVVISSFEFPVWVDCTLRRMAEQLLCLFKSETGINRFRSSELITSNLEGMLSSCEGCDRPLCNL